MDLRPSLSQAVAVVLVLAAGAGCGYVPRIPGVTPYRMEIQQGNFVSQEMVAQLKPGMTKDQVRFILGTPMVTDIFHADRWDYIYWREASNGAREQRRLSVSFENGQLSRLDGDVHATGGQTR
jgi:outer membrane protein assembly factor BamE